SDRQTLARALANEKFYGVQIEIASALGKSGGNISRDALLKGMQHANAKVRRACVDRLGSFDHDEAVAAALKAVLDKGDRSYAVERAAMGAYARQGRNDAVAVLSPWLTRPSYNDVLRSAVLSALGNTKDLSALDLLLEWAQPGKPRNARSAAIRGLNDLMK